MSYQNIFIFLEIFDFTDIFNNAALLIKVFRLDGKLELGEGKK